MRVIASPPVLAIPPLILRLASRSVVIFALAGFILGCRGGTDNPGTRGGYVMRGANDCLPDITLVDQFGTKVALASLKGKPALIDFIYTTCPGPCLMLTSHMKRIATQLGPALGSELHFVSITVDPEHDHPEELRNYARAQAADLPGWLFLTGEPKQIDEVMARFNLIRRRENTGVIDHVLEFFLVGPDGGALLQYKGETADPTNIVEDLKRAAEGKSLALRKDTLFSVEF